MQDAPCRLLGEIRYPEEYSFERVGEIESEAGEVLAGAVAGMDVARLEVTPGPESLRFEVACEECSAEDGAAVSEALLELAGDGPLGRLVVVRGVEEPISVFYFSGEKLDEITLEQP
ncbi:conserved hypothetical protein [Solidesulfovibrio fructosivorans JJ]]|uniref:Uncharacterized protein n=1 Tax=Solidesulfovibrio fructosivorans JJ] TaxID=596151 RepID=E1JXH3_SOLFR|nr:hypothetical protein [Solidesulfovibrio fructosivorans]EFL50950.1 conserved hypothetical protein [Solidesulfovibrio fructosivorans JJ]]